MKSPNADFAQYDRLPAAPHPLQADVSVGGDGQDAGSAVPGWWIAPVVMAGGAIWAMMLF